MNACPAIPDTPEDALMGKEKIDLGAWEIGTTADGDTYKYGSLTGTNPRKLKYDGGTVAVNAENLECWAKGYYRLRKILQTPPAAYVALHKAGFQYRFFQFQTDLRNGTTGFKKISSFQDHLVKWVTVITAAGVCEQPTLSEFRDYAKGELTRVASRFPPGTDLRRQRVRPTRPIGTTLLLRPSDLDGEHQHEAGAAVPERSAPISATGCPMMFLTIDRPSCAATVALRREERREDLAR